MIVANNSNESRKRNAVGVGKRANHNSEFLNGKGEEIVNVDIVNVDLVETFNYLIGLKIDRYKFLKENGRKYVFVFGERNNRRTAIVWRPFKNIDLKKDKEIIDKELEKFNPDEIFINSDSCVKGYKAIESEFKTFVGV